MSRPRVAVIGGGLAGLAAAVALSDASCKVHLFESRRQLGGRAASFRDPASGMLVDFCQHVSMGCCTNLADFARRTNIAQFFERERTLHFVGPDGTIAQFTATGWLPAPLHLAIPLLRLTFLPLRDRWRVARGLLSLGRGQIGPCQEPTMLAWLRDHGQSELAINRFWATVLVSALGDTLDRVSLSAGRKVFVDGFMRNRASYEVLIPTQPLSQLFNEHVARYLTSRDVQIHLSCSTQNVRQQADSFFLDTPNESAQAFDFILLAVPWRQIGDVLDPTLQSRLPDLASFTKFESSPITGVHLWFDRSITDLPHAVIVDRPSQWLFNRGEVRLETGTTSHYYQVVISASRTLAGSDRSDVVRQVIDDLITIWPTARQARLVQSKVVSEQHAVFTPAPNLDYVRPSAATKVSGLFLAGDWTRTGWPATMEGAVRSGYLAAEALLAAMGRPAKVVVDDLPMSRLAQQLIR